MMKILLTGATGFIGSNLISHIASLGEVFACTRDNKGSGHKSCHWLPVDFTNVSSLESQLPQSVDVIVHLAQSRGYRNFPEQAKDMFDVNVASTAALLDYARTHGVSKFLFASTANVYKQSTLRITEDCLPEPSSYYARSKRMAELLVESYAGIFECNILRFFTVYGCGQKGMLVPSLVEKIRSKIPIQIVGGEGIALSPIYVDDICRYILSMVSKEAKPSCSFYNIGGQESLSIREMAEVVGTLLGITPIFEKLEGNASGGWVADNSKVDRDFDIINHTSFEYGMKMVVHHDG